MASRHILQLSSLSLQLPIFFFFIQSVYLTEGIKIDPLFFPTTSPNLLPTCHASLTILHSINRTGSSRFSRLSSKGPYFYTSYQRTIECTASFPPIQPTSLEELQTIVRYALKNNYRVKAVGHRHSITDAICTDGILLDMTQINHFSFNSKSHHATVGAGMEMFDFLEHLHKNGRGISCAPSHGGVTVGGAVSMGAHGTNLKHPASPSDLLTSVTFVDGRGNIRRITEADEDFEAFRVNLGLLGIIYELVFKTTEQYKIEMKTFATDDRILFTGDKIRSIAESNDFFQFFWFPRNTQVVMSVGNRVGVNASGNCQSYLESESSFIHSNLIGLGVELLQAVGSEAGYFLVQTYAKLAAFMRVPIRTPVYTGVDDENENCLPRAVGYSHRMMMNKCIDCPWPHGKFALVIEDNAAAIDLEELPTALETLRELLDKYPASFPIVGIIFRFLRKSDSYLGASSNRTTVEIEWVTVPRFDRTQPKLGITTFQAIGQAMIEKHDGRPAWSKGGLYYTSAAIVHRAYPNLNKFVDVMKRMDPYEIFMNDFGRRIKYGSGDMTLSRAAKKRCALNEACLCKEDSDCGAGGLMDYVCGEVMEFRVCKKRSHSLGKGLDFLSRHFVSLAAGLWNYISDAFELKVPSNDL